MGLKLKEVSLMDSVNKLEKALKQGYLLHGSPHIIQGKCLMPRLANLVTEATEAVEHQPLLYAICHIEVAIARAVLHPGEGKSRQWSKSSPETGRVKIFGCENVKFKDGYVYVLPSKEFHEREDDLGTYTATVPVVPIQKVKVTYQDLLNLQSEFGFIIDIR
jgi:hypothetical protein